MIVMVMTMMKMMTTTTTKVMMIIIMMMIMIMIMMMMHSCWFHAHAVCGIQLIKHYRWGEYGIDNNHIFIFVIPGLCWEAPEYTWFVFAHFVMQILCRYLDTYPWKFSAHMCYIAISMAGVIAAQWNKASAAMVLIHSEFSIVHWG